MSDLLYRFVIAGKRRPGFFAPLDFGIRTESFWLYAVWPVLFALMCGLAFGGFFIWFALVVTGH